MKRMLLFAVFVAFTTLQLEAAVTYSIPLKGEEHQIGNLLEWSTQSEDNSQMFVIEKSEDGLAYVNVGLLDAAGISDGERGYRFLDVNATKKKTYYRLKQLDLDGTASYSQTISISKLMQNEFMVVSMSNTRTNKLFDISIDAVEEGQLKYELKSMKDELVLEGQLDLMFGLNDLTVNLEDEKEGIYKLTLHKGTEKEMLVVQKVDDEIKKKENVASKDQEKGGR